MFAFLRKLIIIYEKDELLIARICNLRLSSVRFNRIV